MTSTDPGRGTGDPTRLDEAWLSDLFERGLAYLCKHTLDGELL